MATETTVDLTDELAASVAESGIPLAKLIRRGLLVTPRLIETYTGGDFVTHWYCEPPGNGVRFRITADEWNQVPGHPRVRDVYKVEITDPGH